MSLITIADLELRLGKTITGTTDEALYTSLISTIQSEAEAICNRTFDSASYTEVSNGTGQDFILLEQYPVTTLTSITVVDTDDTVIYTYDSDEYVLDGSEGSVFSKVKFPRGTSNISIVYDAGWTTETAPDHLKDILIGMVEEAKNTTFKDSNVTEEKLGDYSYKKSSVQNIVKNQSYLLNLYIKVD